MNQMNKLLVIAGDRLGNYETLAPIVHQFIEGDYELMTIFQSNNIVSMLKKNSTLRGVYDNGNIVVLRRWVDFFVILRVLYYIIRTKGGWVLTNRELVSLKFKILRFFIRLFGWKVLYTKSFSRPPTANMRSLVGGSGRSQCNRNLSDFCLIPTSGHMLEYGVLGYRLNHMIITGYPKLWVSWVSYTNRKSLSIGYTDYLIVLGIYYDGLETALSDILRVISDVSLNTNVLIKPHPTTKIDLIERIVDTAGQDNVEITSNNVASQSIRSGVVITHGTSTCIDAAIGSYVICYWGKDHTVVKEYCSSDYDERDGFVIMESNRLCKDFVDKECYMYEDLYREINFVKNKGCVAASTITNRDDYRLLSILSSKINISEFV
jgi:hypothetical protein